MKLGVLSKVFSRPTVEAVFDAIAAADLECIQLNLESAGLAPVPEEIPASLPQRIRYAAATSRIGIASVQGTFNMSHPDAEFRREGLRRLARIAAMCQSWAPRSSPSAWARGIGRTCALPSGERLARGPGATWSAASRRRSRSRGGRTSPWRSSPR